MSTLHISVRRRLCRFLASAALVSAATALPGGAFAATARVTWQPQGTGATGYGVYVRNAGATYGSSPLWTGNPTPAADGSMSATVTYTSASSGVNYFAVVSRNATSESALSAELPVGTPNPCRHDSCLTKTSCDFTSVADGSSCDDGVFCNGAEVCLNGTCNAGAVRSCADNIDCTVDTCDEAAAQCTHVGPPGCCLACDSDDPCLADACTEGDCRASTGVELAVNRLKLADKAGGITLAAKGRFDADPNIDVTTTGVVFELRSVDGTVLYTSRIDGNRISAGATGGRYRYAVSRSQADVLTNGLSRLDFRVKGSTWLVSVKAQTLRLAAALQESDVTWMIKLGSDGCARRMNMACKKKASLSICR